MHVLSGEEILSLEVNEVANTNELDKERVN
jgi:hypothetical protein